MKKLMIACALSLAVCTAQAEDLGDQGRSCYQQYVEALASHDIAKACAALKQRADLDAKNLQWRYDAASFMLDYGMDEAAALEYLTLGMDLIAKSGDDSWKSFYEARLADAYLAAGDAAKAQVSADAALEAYTKLSRKDRFLAAIHRTLADILLSQGKAPGAVIQADQTLNMLQDCGLADGITAARAYLSRSQAKLQQNDADGAKSDLAKAQELFAALGLENDPKLVSALKTAALASDDPATALEYAQRELKQLEDNGKNESPEYVAALEELGAMLLSQGKSTEAFAQYARAYEVNVKLHGADTPESSQDLLQGYRSACAMLASDDEAAANAAHEFLNTVAFKVTLNGTAVNLLGVEAWSLNSDSDLFEGLAPLPDDQELAVLIEQDGGLSQQLVHKSDLADIVPVKTDPAEHQRLMQILSLSDEPVPLTQDDTQASSEDAAEPAAPAATESDTESTEPKSEAQSTAILLNELNELDHVWDEDGEQKAEPTQDAPAASAEGSAADGQA